jgi:hypothetical protein
MLAGWRDIRVDQEDSVLMSHKRRGVGQERHIFGFEIGR